MNKLYRILILVILSFYVFSLEATAQEKESESTQDNIIYVTGEIKNSEAITLNEKLTVLDVLELIMAKPNVKIKYVAIHRLISDSDRKKIILRLKDLGKKGVQKQFLKPFDVLDFSSKKSRIQ